MQRFPLVWKNDCILRLLWILIYETRRQRVSRQETSGNNLGRKLSSIWRRSGLCSALLAVRRSVIIQLIPHTSCVWSLKPVQWEQRLSEENNANYDRATHGGNAHFDLFSIAFISRESFRATLSHSDLAIFAVMTEIYFGLWDTKRILCLCWLASECSCAIWGISCAL